MITMTPHQITPRVVKFDFSNSQIHWISNDPFSSHTFNGINLLLPAGEFWFCRVYNKALPKITDPQLKKDVQAFIRQEAIHARAHLHGQDYLKAHHYDIEHGLKISNTLFGTLLADKPFDSFIFKHKKIEEYWLIMRVGIIAAIEHFTGAIGQWALDNETTWEKNQVDPKMSDLFLWHLAEEVEHRSVAFDLFHHLLEHKLGFYISRQVIMAAVFPIFLYLLVEVGISLARQDNDKDMQKLVRSNFFRILLELERVGKRTGNVPTFTFLSKSVLRWLSPNFHPEQEGDTEQALAYFARSQAVKAGQSSKAAAMVLS